MKAAADVGTVAGEFHRPPTDVVYYISTSL